MHISRALFVVVLTLMLALALTACGGGSADSPEVVESPREIIVAKQSDPSGLDPHMASDEAAIRCIENMYNTLLTYTPTYGEVAPSLAKSYEVSGDNLVYTLQL